MGHALVHTNGHMLLTSMRVVVKTSCLPSQSSAYQQRSELQHSATPARSTSCCGSLRARGASHNHRTPNSRYSNPAAVENVLFFLNFRNFIKQALTIYCSLRTPATLLFEVWATYTPRPTAQV